MIAPDALSIDYSSGEVYDDELGFIQPTPAWCIWLSNPDSKDGTGIFLDTQSRSTTEFSILSHNIVVSCMQYDAMTLQDRWMAHQTLPVIDFSSLWKRKLERLVWMPVPRPTGPTAKWYITCITAEDEEDILRYDDDFLVSTNDLDEETSEDDEMKEAETEEDVEISAEEVDDLMEDAYGLVRRFVRNVGFVEFLWT